QALPMAATALSWAVPTQSAVFMSCAGGAHAPTATSPLDSADLHFAAHFSMPPASFVTAFAVVSSHFASSFVSAVCTPQYTNGSICASAAADTSPTTCVARAAQSAPG